MPLNIFLFYQHIGREYESLVRIRRELLALEPSCNVAIRSIDFEWVQACREARRCGVDIVVMPWLYVDLNYALMLPFLDVNPGAVIVNLHQEQISSPGSQVVLEPKGDAERNGCFHFCWGEYFADVLKGCDVRESLIRITGNARLDQLVTSEAPFTRGELASRYSLDPSKKWVLFAESRGWVLKATPKYKSEMLNMGLRDDLYEEGKRLDRDSMAALFAQMNALSDSYFDSCELIYRAHPGTSVGDGLNPRVKEISAEPIGTWLKAIDLLAMWGSTSAFEAEICGVPVVCHQPVTNPDWHSVAGLSEFTCIKDIAQTLDVLDGSIPLKCDEKLYERYYGIVDGCRSHSVAEAILEVTGKSSLQTAVFTMPQELIGLVRRKKAFEAVTRLVCKLGLLEKLHWPNSAFLQKNDIPYYDDNISSWN